MDARGGPSADTALVRQGAVIGSMQEGTAVQTRPSGDWDGATVHRRRLDEALDRERWVRPDPPPPDDLCPPVGDVETVLLSRGWVETPLDWQWRAAGAVHARVLTSCDGGACLVLGGTHPGDWSGHLDAPALLSRLDDIERHRAGAPLPLWAVTDTLLADLTLATDPARSWWHAWTVERGTDHTLTMTTTTGPMAERRPRITFEPRAARDAVRSPQAVRLHLAGHPVRSFWAHRLLPLVNLLQGHPEPATDLCDVTDQVEAAWDLHRLLEVRDGWCFTGTCHGTWRRGHPLFPVVTLGLTRTPDEVVVDLCGDAPGVVGARARTTAAALACRLDELEAHHPGRSVAAWGGGTDPTPRCSLR